MTEIKFISVDDRQRMIEESNTAVIDITMRINGITYSRGISAPLHDINQEEIKKLYDHIFKAYMYVLANKHNANLSGDKGGE